jgi:hypothetical protein
MLSQAIQVLVCASERKSGRSSGGSCLQGITEARPGETEILVQQALAHALEM